MLILHLQSKRESPSCFLANYGAKMKKMIQLTAVIEREGNGYVSTCPELDIVSQGLSVEEARLNLLEAVEGFFEVASPSEIRRRLKSETYIMPILPTVPTVRARQLRRANHA
jgi:predicted RNase H-like HicB family nuclease